MLLHSLQEKMAIAACPLCVLARKARAKLVQAVADEFVDAFVSAAGLQAHVSVYMHVIKCHLCC